MAEDVPCLAPMIERANVGDDIRDCFPRDVWMFCWTLYEEENTRDGSGNWQGREKAIHTDLEIPIVQIRRFYPYKFPESIPTLFCLGNFGDFARPIWISKPD